MYEKIKKSKNDFFKITFDYLVRGDDLNFICDYASEYYMFEVIFNGNVMDNIFIDEHFNENENNINSFVKFLETINNHYFQKEKFQRVQIYKLNDETLYIAFMRIIGDIDILIPYKVLKSLSEKEIREYIKNYLNRKLK
jgi:hypothetical protein